MEKRPTPTPEEVQALKAKVRDKALEVLAERAKTDPEARAGLAKLRKKGVIPNA